MVVVRRALLIVNPGSRRGASSLGAATRAFTRAGVACDVHTTTHAGHAEQLARALGAQYDAVFTLGGDGTVMEVLHALQGSDTPVGVLPAGTGNLVARALRIPMSIPKAVAALVAADAVRIDLGRLDDGRVFAFAAGVGIDVTMVQRTSARAKRRFGVLAYVVSGTRAALAMDTFALRVTVDGVPHDFRATAALVANFGSVLGGLIRLGPDIRENDGMLDLCVFSPASVPDALRLGWRLLRHDFGTDPSMHFLRGRTLQLETSPRRATQADGELLGGSTLHVTVAPGAARLLVPPGTR
ncbi:MAG: diacylglycerol/lipid kinase family protein [Gemmatimonadota bacterium]